MAIRGYFKCIIILGKKIYLRYVFAFIYLLLPVFNLTSEKKIPSIYGLISHVIKQTIMAANYSESPSQNSNTNLEDFFKMFDHWQQVYSAMKLLPLCRNRNYCKIHKNT